MVNSQLPGRSIVTDQVEKRDWSIVTCDVEYGWSIVARREENMFFVNSHQPGREDIMEDIISQKSPTRYSKYDWSIVPRQVERI